MNESQNQIVFPTLSQPVPGVQIVEREGQSGERVKFPGGGGHFRKFWVGRCRWDPGTLDLYQS